MMGVAAATKMPRNRTHRSIGSLMTPVLEHLGVLWLTAESYRCAV